MKTGIACGEQNTYTNLGKYSGERDLHSLKEIL